MSLVQHLKHVHVIDAYDVGASIPSGWPGAKNHSLEPGTVTIFRNAATLYVIIMDTPNPLYELIDWNRSRFIGVISEKYILPIRGPKKGSNVVRAFLRDIQDVASYEKTSDIWTATFHKMLSFFNSRDSFELLPRLRHTLDLYSQFPLPEKDMAKFFDYVCTRRAMGLHMFLHALHRSVFFETNKEAFHRELDKRIETWGKPTLLISKGMRGGRSIDYRDPNNELIHKLNPFLVTFRGFQLNLTLERHVDAMCKILETDLHLLKEVLEYIGWLETKQYLRPEKQDEVVSGIFEQLRSRISIKVPSEMKKQSREIEQLAMKFINRLNVPKMCDRLRQKFEKGNLETEDVDEEIRFVKNQMTAFMATVQKDVLYTHVEDAVSTIRETIIQLLNGLTQAILLKKYPLFPDIDPLLHEKLGPIREKWKKELNLMRSDPTSNKAFVERAWLVVGHSDDDASKEKTEDNDKVKADKVDEAAEEDPMEIFLDQCALSTKTVSWVDGALECKDDEGPIRWTPANKEECKAFEEKYKRIYAEDRKAFDQIDASDPKSIAKSNEKDAYIKTFNVCSQMT